MRRQVGGHESRQAEDQVPQGACTGGKNECRARRVAQGAARHTRHPGGHQKHQEPAGRVRPEARGGPEGRVVKAGALCGGPDQRGRHREDKEEHGRESPPSADHDEGKGGDDHREQGAHHLHPEALWLSAEKPHRRADERSDHDGGRQPEKAEHEGGAGAGRALKEGVDASAPRTLEKGEPDRDRHRHRHQDVDLVPIGEIAQTEHYHAIHGDPCHGRNEQAARRGIRDGAGRAPAHERAPERQ